MLISYVNRGVAELVRRDKLLVATFYLLVSWSDFMSLIFSPTWIGIQDPLSMAR